MKKYKWNKEKFKANMLGLIQDIAAIGIIFLACCK